MSAPRRWARALLLALAAAVLPARAAPPAAPAPASALTELPPGVALPVPVRLAVRVLNVTQLAEVAGTAQLYLETTQRWHDPRLAFDPLQTGVQRVDRIGEEARAYLQAHWTPGLVADNQIGEPRSHTVAVSTHADGEVVVVERAESLFRVEMDMAAFPFDRQALVIGFSLPRHARQEAVLLSTEADRRLSGVEPHLSLAQWSPLGLRFAHDQATGWNARSYARLTATLDLERDAWRYVLRIFIPIIAILGVSLFVLWAPGLAPKDEGSLVFSSLLALAALSFTFESSFPGAISMNTPVAQIISLGYLYLVAVLFVRSLLGRHTQDPASPHHRLALALSRQVRWLLPLAMTVVCVGAAVRALPVR